MTTEQQSCRFRQHQSQECSVAYLLQVNERRVAQDTAICAEDAEADDEEKQVDEDAERQTLDEVEGILAAVELLVDKQEREEHDGAVHEENAPEGQRLPVEIPVDEFIEAADASDALQCQEDDLEVFAQTLVLDVLHIQLQLVGHHLLHIYTVRILGITQKLVLVHILYGSIVGDAGFDVEHLPLLRGIHLHIFPHLRPGPHETHIPSQHIPQLGQFVELVFADEVPDACDAVVVLADGDEALTLRVSAHRTELVESEGLAAQSDAFLYEEARPLAAQLDKQPENQKQG